MIQAAEQILWIGAPVAFTSVAAGLAQATFAPRCTIWGPMITRGSAQDPPRVALTFDDGPLPGATERILDVLGELNVRATFFAIGRAARQHPRVLARVHAAGHLVGNHSYDHLGLGFLHGREFWERQLDETDAAIQDAIGVCPRLFRPPLGIKTWSSARVAARRHTVVTWTRRALDGVTTSSRRIIGRLVPHARAGEILALHDGISPQSRRDPTATVKAMRPLVLGLRARGIEPVRLDELAAIEPYAA